MSETSSTSETGKGLRTEIVPPEQLLAELRQIPVFADLDEQNLSCLKPLEVVHAEAGAELVAESQTWRSFWVLLNGEVRISKREGAGASMLVATMNAGEAFGELPILAGTGPGASVVMSRTGTLVRFDEEAFWQLMFSCPRVRGAVLGNMARRLQAYQSQTVHREKLALLGTMAAGLMHELNNPGAAARRAASQMRENLRRLQQISLRMTRSQATSEQVECMAELQEQALSTHCCVAMSSLEESDAADALTEWLDDAGVENAWRLSPVLIATGLDETKLACARAVFSGAGFSDMLNWLEALVSSAQLVGTMEESLARVTDLVMAVKRYSYEGKNGPGTLDVHSSIQSTLVILAHKFKEKQLTVVKEFAPDLPLLQMPVPGLNQVWTNLLDNAIDASPAGGTIHVRTWSEDGRLFVSVLDHGQGIAPEDQQRIFEPFFTTKAVGQGTGLGLEIVRRIAVHQMGGDVRVISRPGETQFTVELPLHSESSPAPTSEQLS